ncbi:class I tRNA ligase family protein [Escherichia coli]
MSWRNRQLKRLRTATFSSYRSSTKTAPSLMRDIQDWCISRQLCGSPPIRYGTTKRVTFMLAATKTKCVIK